MEILQGLYTATDRSQGCVCQGFAKSVCQPCRVHPSEEVVEPCFGLLHGIILN